MPLLHEQARKSAKARLADLRSDLLVLEALLDLTAVTTGTSAAHALCRQLESMTAEAQHLALTLSRGGVSFRGWQPCSRS